MLRCLSIVLVFLACSCAAVDTVEERCAHYERLVDSYCPSGVLTDEEN